MNRCAGHACMKSEAGPVKMLFLGWSQKTNQRSQLQQIWG